MGGTGILPMKDLAALCADLGFLSVKTWIQSGNVLFESPLQENQLRAQLQSALAAWAVRNFGFP